ncbi:MAG: hypothetical protein MUD08_07845 [Cytophagales bacterium]|jgi:hypothetical protein|nr:hypothetical protein [Cytophagales bacterium]
MEQKSDTSTPQPGQAPEKGGNLLKSMTNYVNDAAKDDDEDAPSVSGGLTYLAVGLGLIALAVYLFFEFTNLETNGGSMRIHWLAALLYKIGGKWVTCLVMGIIGLGSMYLGYEQYKKAKSAK